jgi:crotonobetainyl-CoA:carnitine CoA-transferase CaiB-like acyl-CoA transferase
LNFNDPDQLAALANMLTEADVVIEASRPRALQGLGLDRETLTVIKPQIWLSLTAYGRDDPNGQWVGFGDDVAVSANLLQWTAEGRPEFLGDAVADPLTGTLAALAVAHAVSVGQSGLLDLSMAAVASQCRRKVLSSERALFCPLRKVSHAD